VFESIASDLTILTAGDDIDEKLGEFVGEVIMDNCSNY